MKTQMFKFSDIPLTLRRVFTPELREQYRAGLIDKELRLTERGQRAIWIALQNDYAEQLTARAKEIIAENCEEKNECK